MTMLKAFGLGIPLGNERGLEVPVSADCRASLRCNVAREKKVNGQMIMDLPPAYLCRYVSFARSLSPCNGLI